MTLALIVLVGMEILRSPELTSAAAMLRSSLSAWTSMPFWEATLVSAGKSSVASRAGRSTRFETRFTRPRTASLE